MMYKNKPKLKIPAKASLWYIGASAVSKGAGIVATPFFTRLQSEGEYGSYTLYITLLGVLSVTASAFTSGSSIYKGLRSAGENTIGYIHSALAASLGFSGVICILLFAFSSFSGLGVTLTVLISLQLLCDSIVAIRLSEARFSYRYNEVFALGIFEAVLAPLIAILIFYRFGGDFRVRVYSMLAVSALVAMYSLIRILGKRQGGKKRKGGYRLRESLSLLPHTVLSALSGQADKLAFTAILGTVALGKYSIAHSLGLGLAFVVSAVGSALNPWIIRRLAEGDFARISEVVDLIFRALAACTVALVALSPEAMRILAPEGYLEALPAVLPIALSVLPGFITSICTVCLVHYDRSLSSAFSSLIGGVSGVIFMFLLIPPLSYLGAGIALLISQLIVATISLHHLSREGCRIFDTRRILIHFMSALAFGALAVLLYDYLALRVLLLTLPAVSLLGSLFSAERLVKE